MSTPQLSIIIPVYKVEAFLSRCVESVLSQTFKDFECILIDDGSPDRCPEICDEYAAKDSRVKVIHQKNSGVSAARNAGVSASSAQWITFVDSDDWIDADLYAKAFSKITSGTDVIVWGYVTENGKTPAEKTEWKDISTVSQLVCDHSCLFNSCWSKLYSKKILEQNKIQFDEELFMGEDLFFNVQYFCNVKNFKIINGSFYHYFENPESITRIASTQKEKFEPVTRNDFESSKKILDFLKDKSPEIWSSFIYRQILLYKISLIGLKEFKKARNDYKSYNKKFLKDKGLDTKQRIKLFLLFSHLTPLYFLYRKIKYSG